MSDDPEISFEQILANEPAGTLNRVATDETTHGTPCLFPPLLHLHCDKDTCAGVRVFETQHETIWFSKNVEVQTIEYHCRNCQVSFKHYSIAVFSHELEHYVFKLGEMPRLDPPTPQRLISMIGEERELFLAGRRCELQGLGIGAFTYYRRVVESQTNRIISKIIDVAEKLGSDPQQVAVLKSALEKPGFADALELAGPAIPDSLRFGGQSPLTLLYKSLSKGVHTRSDAECLEDAHAIREVLSATAVRIQDLLAENENLRKAIARLRQ